MNLFAVLDPFDTVLDPKSRTCIWSVENNIQVNWSDDVPLDTKTEKKDLHRDGESVLLSSGREV